MNFASGMQPFASVEFITPAMAEHFLQGNTENYRGLRKPLVSKYASDMARGLWTLTTSAIGVTVSGKVSNGQHRLSAVVESGMGQWFVVLRNLPCEALQDPNEDTGSRRSIATHLFHAGVANSNATAAAARFLWSLRSSSRKAGQGKEISDAMIAKVIAANEGIAEASTRAMTTSRIAKPSIAGSWLWLASFENKTLAEECIDVLAGRADASTNHPFAKLREVLMQSRMDKRTHGGMKGEMQFRYMMAAWEKAKAGSTVKLLRPANTLKISDAADRALQLMGM